MFPAVSTLAHSVLQLLSQDPQLFQCCEDKRRLFWYNPPRPVTMWKPCFLVMQFQSFGKLDSRNEKMKILRQMAACGMEEKGMPM
jgi:hypothetical protein